MTAVIAFWIALIAYSAFGAGRELWSALRELGHSEDERP